MKASTEILKQMKELGMDDRSVVLFWALNLEHVTQSVLKSLLRIEGKSVIFGHTSKALGFNQRMLLLLEMGVLDPKRETSIRWMMEIRNQMAHNYESTSFEKCLGFTSFKAEGLLKKFPSTGKDMSERLENSFILMATDTQEGIRELYKETIEEVKKRTNHMKAYSQYIRAKTRRMQRKLQKAELELQRLQSDPDL